METRSPHQMFHLLGRISFTHEVRVSHFKDHCGRKKERQTMICPSNHEKTKEEQKPDTNSQVLIKVYIWGGRKRRKSQFYQHMRKCLSLLPWVSVPFLGTKFTQSETWRYCYFSISTDFSFSRRVCGWGPVVLHNYSAQLCLKCMLSSPCFRRTFQWL